MTITLTWWMFPTILMVCSIGYVVFIYNDGGGYLSGLGNLLLLIPALALSCLAWIIAAIFK
jgi:hypothetical protein